MSDTTAGPNAPRSASDSSGGQRSFAPTRAEGLLRLEGFLASAGTSYARGRSADLGPDNRANVSLLSPYLRHRLISEQEVVRAVVARHGSATAEKYIEEVVWRAYWKGWLEMRPTVFERAAAAVAPTRAVLAKPDAKRLTDAESGATGIAPFDAWAKELVETGYLHNHARMWFASIWIHTLKLPWLLGADLFQRHLLDGDAASNTLSWRWVGGLHTRGKSYLAEAANITTHTQGRFDNVAGLATKAMTIEDDAPIAQCRIGDVDRRPVSGRCALLVTEDDLTPENWALSAADVRAVVLLDTAEAYPGVSRRVVNFKRGAMVDTERRVIARFNVQPIVVSALMPDAGRQIAAHCDAAGRIPLVMHEMPVGPAEMEAAPVVAEIKRAGQEVRTLRRPWDDAFWPHATAGFFKMKAAIPETLKALGIKG